MIELHGELNQMECLSPSDNFIGEIFFTNTGTPILIIGIHVLYGKVTALEKPLAIIKKSSHSDGSDSEHPDYVVKAIVKKKLVFKNRPRAIVEKSQS